MIAEEIAEVMLTEEIVAEVMVAEKIIAFRLITVDHIFLCR